MENTLIVTGGAGFIGSELVRRALGRPSWRIVVIDKLTYSGNLESLQEVSKNPRYSFIKADIADARSMREIFEATMPDAIMHLAAESHVDRSIDDPGIFIQSNIVGTYTLLEEARRYLRHLSSSNPAKAHKFRFHHISTDEVFGDLSASDTNAFFNERTPYAPSSPYSASKASSDHLVRAWQRTFNLPTLITNCSNNYGPRQFPEKLIPLMLINALNGKPLPVYGRGEQIRDWLYVGDHADALLLVLEKGRVGETYTIGGHCEKRNLDVVRKICDLLDEKCPDKPHGIEKYSSLITFVPDRPGHDARYAIDAAKIGNELGWKPREDFNSGMDRTVDWYLGNRHWWQNILNGTYRCERQGLPEEN